MFGLEHRHKIVYLRVNEVMTLLGGWKHHDFISLPLIKGLPEGYTVVDATYDFAHRAIAVIVSHPSFPDVPEGCRIPALVEGLSECETVDLRQMASSAAITATSISAAPFITIGPLSDAERKKFKEAWNEADRKRFEDAVVLDAQSRAAADLVKAMDEGVYVDAGCKVTQVAPPAEPPKPEKKPWEFLGDPRL